MKTQITTEEETNILNGLDELVKSKNSVMLKYAVSDLTSNYILTDDLKLVLSTLIAKYNLDYIVD